jgi:hypothetical protein
LTTPLANIYKPKWVNEVWVQGEEIPYDELRKAEYPPVGDQLDALWKLIGPTAPKDSEAKIIFDKCVAIKEKYPKLP